MCKSCAVEVFGRRPWSTTVTTFHYNDMYKHVTGTPHVGRTHLINYYNNTRVTYSDGVCKLWRLFFLFYYFFFSVIPRRAVTGLPSFYIIVVYCHCYYCYKMCYRQTEYNTCVRIFFFSQLLSRWFEIRTMFLNCEVHIIYELIMELK